jgi:hypothetical protein
MREFKFNIVTLIVGKAFKSFQPGGALHLSRYFSVVPLLPSPLSLIPTLPLSPLYTLLFFILQPTIFLLKILIFVCYHEGKMYCTISFCLKNNILLMNVAIQNSVRTVYCREDRNNQNIIYIFTIIYRRSTFHFRILRVRIDSVLLLTFANVGRENLALKMLCAHVCTNEKFI